MLAARLKGWVAGTVGSSRRRGNLAFAGRSCVGRSAAMHKVRWAVRLHSRAAGCTRELPGCCRCRAWSPGQGLVKRGSWRQRRRRRRRIRDGLVHMSAGLHGCCEQLQDAPAQLPGRPRSGRVAPAPSAHPGPVGLPRRAGRHRGRNDSACSASVDAFTGGVAPHGGRWAARERWQTVPRPQHHCRTAEERRTALPPSPPPPLPAQRPPLRPQPVSAASARPCKCFCSAQGGPGGRVACRRTPQRRNDTASGLACLLQAQPVPLYPLTAPAAASARAAGARGRAQPPAAPQHPPPRPQPSRPAPWRAQ